MEMHLILRKFYMVQQKLCHILLPEKKKMGVNTLIFKVFGSLSGGQPRETEAMPRQLIDAAARGRTKK
jgi:hypothetical protein